MAEPPPGESSFAVTPSGQVIVGVTGVRVSTIVTVKLHESPVAVEQVTVVLPMGKKAPDGGLQVTPVPPPSSGGGGHVPEAVGVV